MTTSFEGTFFLSPIVYLSWNNLFTFRGTICLPFVEQFVYLSWNNLFTFRGTICLPFVEQFVYLSWNNLFTIRGTICLPFVEQFSYVFILATFFLQTQRLICGHTVLFPCDILNFLVSIIVRICSVYCSNMLCLPFQYALFTVRICSVTFR